MFKLNPNPRAVKFYYEKVSEIIDKIIDERIASGLLEISTRKFLKQYKNILIQGKPELLLKVHQKFKNTITDQNTENLKTCFKERAYKEHFQRYFGKEFLNLLNIDTCVYCNRNYTLQFDLESNHTRAQLDHWFPKADFPILALSFYNLIPSCSSCNHIKGQAKEYDWEKALENLVHPYSDSIDFSFSYDFDKYNEPKIWLVQNNSNLKNEQTIKFNKLREIYEAQSGKELKDLYDLRYKYSQNYLDILCNKTFEGLSLSQEEAYRMVFGIEIKKDDYHKRPFSKFKHDIIEELKKNI
ncbi:HNH endonuclease [Chryseobacterium caseinilyticum]|uniref:HNH domain-containing protein n=1 Tax=Chryseobacterium caseinilyticum TaxID=2771428 RepID=A0ABR8Z9G6_9FLAO|nr:HNH endonuclease [Chryseobacterium caseinilyticum]MBD8081580.1 hypothetical protein [Chryseobacterium caseinilyticum]